MRNSPLYACFIAFLFPVFSGTAGFAQSANELSSPDPNKGTSITMENDVPNAVNQNKVGRVVQSSGTFRFRSAVYFYIDIPANAILKEVQLSYTSKDYIGSKTKIVQLAAKDVAPGGNLTDWFNTLSTGTGLIWENIENYKYSQTLISQKNNQSLLFDKVEAASKGDKWISFGLSIMDDANVTQATEFTLTMTLIWERHFMVTVKNSYTTPSPLANTVYIDKGDGLGFQSIDSGTPLNLLKNQIIQIKSETPKTIGGSTYEFVNWSNSPANLKTQNPYTLTVSADETWTATFNKKIAVSFWNKENTTNLAGSKLLLDGADEVTSGDFRPLLENTTHTVKTRHETWDNNRIKHNNWNEKPEEFKLSHTRAFSDLNPNDVAQFKELKPVTVVPTIDGIPVAGPIEFSDPWFVDQYGNQPGGYTPYPAGLTGATLPRGGVFLKQKYDPAFPNNPYYKVKVSQTATLAGLEGKFLNWSGANATVSNPSNTETPVSFNAANDAVYANYDVFLASKSSGWVQSTTQYSGNGTKTIVYKTPAGSGEDVWLHTESSGGVKETWVSSVGLPDANMAWALSTADYNGQKQYYAEMMIDKNIGLNLTVKEYVNGQSTHTLLYDYFHLTDLGAASLSLTAKVYVSPYANTTGFPATFTNFLVVVVDGLKVYTKVAAMNNGVVSSWTPWSTFTITSSPVVSTNGKTMYINWIENGNLVGRRYLNTSWGSTYTLYSNSGGNFINFTATVNSTDDLVLMMTRQNSLNSRSMCYGKRYLSGGSAPLTVLETMGYSLYNAYSVAAENGKIVASIGKSSPDGEVFSYYLWKNDGTNWTKETTAFSSSPARLLHNEVDVRPYEFATATTPALYALKTSPVSWGGNGLEKVDQESGLSVVAARLGDTLTWYTTVDPVSVDSMLVDTTGLWHIVVKSGEAREILISGLNRFGSAVWVDSCRTVQFTPAEARYTFWVVDPTGNKMRYAKDQSDPEEAEFKLEDQVSVFPNPFNPATVFSVTVAEPSRVKLHIYNVIGQQVAELVNGDLTAGVHDYRLTAGSWASGTYFYRLQIGDKLKSGKIQLVK